jgi:hypothetical protein
MDNASLNSVNKRVEMLKGLGDEVIEQNRTSKRGF